MVALLSFKESFRVTIALKRPLHWAGKIAFLLLLCGHPVPAAKLYPGITRQQSDMCHKALDAFYNGNIRQSERVLSGLDSLEEQDTLIPLSRLLQVATGIMQLQRNDVDGKQEDKRLHALISDAAADGLDACRQVGRHDAAYPTCLILQGGIQGFMATLKISSAPSKALSEGLRALKSLEKALEIDSTIHDAYMGLGIFDCTGANASVMVRATLNMLGRKASKAEGLNYLRRSAYEGQYTSVASLLFLIQFLSPYDGELRTEKRIIFKSLIKSFPQSPYYPFLRNEEALCFYPDSFYQPRARRAFEHNLHTVAAREYASVRYLNLVKYQYTLLNPNPSPALAPDTSLDLREYGFYPVFIEALRAQRKMTRDSVGTPSRADLRRIKTLRDSTLHLLHNSGMSSGNVKLYEWHIRDALKPKVQGKTLEWDSTDVEDSARD